MSNPGLLHRHSQQCRKSSYNNKERFSHDPVTKLNAQYDPNLMFLLQKSDLWLPQYDRRMDVIFSPCFLT